jgi:MFS family permease
MWFLFIGKFLVGLSIGGYTVYCPNFVNEVAPTELKGRIGSALNFMAGAGIFLPAIFGLGIPDKEFIEPNDQSFAIQHYWRVIFGFPILLAIFQSVLLVFVFRFDTPVELKAAGKTDKLWDVMKKLYTTDREAEARILAIKVLPKEDANNPLNGL